MLSCVSRLQGLFEFFACCFLLPVENEQLANNASLSMQAMAANTHLKNICGELSIKYGKNNTCIVDLAGLIGNKDKKFGIEVVYNPLDLYKDKSKNSSTSITSTKNWIRYIL